MQKDVVIGETLGRMGFGRGAVSIPRFRHKFVIGATGSGKSTLLKVLIQADIDAGDGVIVVDPHGQLVDDIAWRIPKHRTNDVIWFDPMSPKVIGLNPLEGKDRLRALEQALKIISTIWPDAWGPQSDYISRNLGLAVIEVEQNPTLVHLLRFFVDPAYARRLSERVKNPTVKAFFATLEEKWDRRQEAQATAPPQNKIDSLLYSPVLRDIFGQERGLDLGRAMNDRKIVLCRFSKGVLGPEAGSFLSAVLTSKILFAALERESSRERPFCGVYIDEFHNATRGNSPEQILSETRKYNIAFTAADQTIAQLPDGSEHAIFGNISTLIAGRLGAQDAERLAKELGYPLEGPAPLQGLANYRWYVKTVRNDGFVTDAIPIDGRNVGPRVGYQTKRMIVKKSSQHWGVPREDVEARFRAAFGGE